MEDGVATHHQAQSHHTYSHTLDNSEMPVSLQRMPLDWRRKLEYPEETPEAEVNMQTSHTYKVEGGP